MQADVGTEDDEEEDSVISEGEKEFDLKEEVMFEKICLNMLHL